VSVLVLEGVSRFVGFFVLCFIFFLLWVVFLACYFVFFGAGVRCSCFGILDLCLGSWFLGFFSFLVIVCGEFYFLVYRFGVLFGDFGV